MGGRSSAEKKQNFGLTQNAMLFVECLLRARSGSSVCILTSMRFQQWGAGQQFIMKAITLIALVTRLKICLKPAPLRGGILGKHFIYCLSIAIMGSQLHH